MQGIKRGIFPNILEPFFKYKISKTAPLGNKLLKYFFCTLLFKLVLRNILNVTERC